MLSLYLIITIGHFIGKIKLRGFALESSAILFVALICGHYGITLPGEFRVMGLLFFIYAIGIQAGPKFLTFFKKEGLHFNILAIIIVSTGAIITAIGVIFLKIKKEIAIGLFAGALTSTPGLASAQEATSSELTSIGYGLAYPFGVIGVILFVKLLPAMLRTDLSHVEELEKEEESRIRILDIHIEVTNESVIGLNLGRVRLLETTGCVISRLQRNDKVIVPRADTELQKGDLLRIVGDPDTLEQAVMLLGKKSHRKIPQRTIDSQRFVITNDKLIGKTLRELEISNKYEANVTRIRRAGIDIPAEPRQKIEWGDRIVVVGEKKIMDELKEYFGDDIKKTEEGNIYSIIFGIVVGFLFGLIPFSIERIISLKFGITGGVLLSGLLLSSRGNIGPLIFRPPTNIINFLREIGLVLFLSVVGCGAGSTLVKVITERGLILFFWGALITIGPMFTVLLVNKYYFKINILQLSGTLTGGMTSTPGLAVASSMTESSLPMVTYAAVYPVAMIMMMIWCKILAVVL